MDEYIDRFKRRVNINGTSNRSRTIAQKIQVFNQYMSNAPNKFNIEINSQHYDITIQDVSFNDENKDDKIVLTYLTTPLTIGTIFQWENKNWIVINIEQDSLPSHICGKIRCCNNTLKFKTDVNTTVSMPCVISDKTYNGTEDGGYFPMPTGKIMVTVPNKNSTATIQKGDKFIFNNKYVYQVKYVNDLGQYQHGLIIFTMEEVLSVPKDDMANNLPYKEFAPINDTPASVGYDVKIIGNAKIKYTTQQSYTAMVYLDGNQVADAVDWTVTDSNDLSTNLVTIIINGNTCLLKAGSVKGTVKLTCQIKSTEIYTEKIIQIIGQF